MTGWLRPDLAGRQSSTAAAHPTAPSRPGARPTIEEQRRPISRARPANAATASGVAATGTRLAPA